MDNAGSPTQIVLCLRMKAPDPSDPPPSFADRVLAWVRELYPDQPARLSPGGDHIRVGKAQFGLANLEAKFQLSDGSDARLRELVRQHFEVVLADHTGELTGRLSWGEAKPILFPQLMPAAFRHQAPLVHRPFVAGVLIGIVIDAERGYRYARDTELDAWGVTSDQAFEHALANLAVKSHDLKVHAVLDRDRFLALQTNDGYDAARILLPRWRALAGEHLDFPFRFGIPNRDFMICWSADTSAHTQAAFRAKLAEDFKRQPYPLSGEAFEMDETGGVTALA